MLVHDLDQFVEIIHVEDSLLAVRKTSDLESVLLFLDSLSSLYLESIEFENFLVQIDS